MRTNFPLTTLSAAVFAIVCAPNTLAQSIPNEIETLTVTGSRLAFDLDKLAASASVLTAEEIRRSGAVQLGDLLRALPGVAIAQSGAPGSLTEIRVRGSESNHLLVLIDGVVANDLGQGSLLDLAHLTADSIARVELLRGPQSALWGSGAVGGVLSITTHAASQQGESVTAGVSAGNRDTQKANIAFNSQQEKSSFNAYADWLNTAGDNISRTGNENDGYENFTAGAKLSYAPVDNHRFSAMMRFTDYTSEYDATDYANTGLPVDAFNETEGEQVTAALDWRFTPSQSDYQSQVKLQYRQDENDSTTYNSSMDRSDAGGTTGRRYQATWVNQYTLANTQFAGGLEYLQRQFEQRGPVVFGDPNQRQHDTTVSAFGEAGAKLHPAVFATLSARYDANSEFENAFSYRAGATWDASSTYSVFVSVGKAIKTPTFTERFGYFPQSFVGNPRLEPETRQEWELGLRARWSSQLSAEISTYHANLEKEIVGIYDPASGANSAINASVDSEQDGIDAQLDYQFGSAMIRASYSYLDASQGEGDNQIIELRRARHHGALTLSGELPDPKWTAYLKLAYTGSRLDRFYPPYPQPAQTIGLSPYTLVSANLAYQAYPEWKLGLRVDNALNSDYEDIVGYAGEKRRVLFTVTYQPEATK